MGESSRALRIVLAVTGVAFLALYPVTMLLPGPWMWEPRQYEYEQMIVGVYFVLGIFTLIAARDPDHHLGLIWFVAVSNVVHGAIMLVQALVDPADRANLVGDVPALLVSGLAIAWLAPKRLGSALAALALGVVLASAPVQAGGDADAGARIAQRWCTACHVVEAKPDTAADATPALPNLATDPKMTPERLRAFLTRPHGGMAGMSFSREEIDDLLAYIAGLAR